MLLLTVQETHSDWLYGHAGAILSFVLQKATLRKKDMGQFASGVGKCPYDPDQEATSLYIREYRYTRYVTRWHSSVLLL